VNLDAVPGTPAEFVPLLEAAEANDMRVHPFPPRSFLWKYDPDGWSWGTDSWMMSLRPRPNANGVRWLIEFGDDEGHNGWLDPALALEVIEGTTIETILRRGQES
jgi:hypothetical protein